MEIIAHRGFSAIAPENTLSSFERAISHGATGIELDLQLSLDHQLVVIHDPTLDRTGKSQGKVCQLTLKELKELEVGSWFKAEFKGEKIPTLGEVLDLFNEQKVGINNQNFSLYIEVKQGDLWQRQEINNLISVTEQFATPVYVTSFNYDFLKRIKQENPLIKIGYNVKTKEEYRQSLSLVKTEENGCICSEYHLLLNQPDLISQTHNFQCKVLAWTVDILEDFKQLQQLNLQGIMTNSLIGNFDKIKV